MIFPFADDFNKSSRYENELQFVGVDRTESLEGKCKVYIRARRQIPHRAFNQTGRWNMLAHHKTFGNICSYEPSSTAIERASSVVCQGHSSFHRSIWMDETAMLHHHLKHSWFPSFQWATRWTYQMLVGHKDVRSFYWQVNE